jgi:ABC-2 type transport system ATP-binding protein
MEMIEVKNLTKKFGRFTAVDDVSFTVANHEIFGLLGPNGAGKTTTIRCLLTLVSPTSGTINIAGIDIQKKPQQARQLCGYVPQEVSVDGDLTGYENLLFYARLYYVPGAERQKRIQETLEFMQIANWANSLVTHYSGGMMRRLEIGQILVNRPRVLFLDEPSIGLDPAAKRMIWEDIHRLREELGTTILLTTHDMVEADELCDRIAIMNGGRIVVSGSPEQLKSDLGGDVVSVNTGADGKSEEVLRQAGYQLLSDSRAGVLDLVVSEGNTAIPRILEALTKKGIETKSVSLKRGTLDDVFLKYAGKRIVESESDWRTTTIDRKTIGRLG